MIYLKYYTIIENDQTGGRISDDEGHSSGFEEEELLVTAGNTSKSSSLALSRLLSRSRGSLLSEDSGKTDKILSQPIILPKDVNPTAAIIQVETMHAFINKVNHQIYKPTIETNNCSTNYKQIVASGRIKEQQVLGCLIVEIFLANQLRATWNIGKTSFIQRFMMCLSTLKTSGDNLPKCIRNIVSLLLQIDIMPKSYNISNIEINDITMVIIFHNIFHQDTS